MTYDASLICSCCCELFLTKYFHYKAQYIESISNMKPWLLSSCYFILYKVSLSFRQKDNHLSSSNTWMKTNHYKSIYPRVHEFKVVLRGSFFWILFMFYATMGVNNIIDTEKSGALYVCLNHTDDDIHSDHSNLDTLGITLNSTLKHNQCINVYWHQMHIHYRL